MAERAATETAVIVNGAAGGGRARGRADAVLLKLASAGFDFDPVFTEAPAHATELARTAYERGVRRFLSVGGDGTSYEVVSGLFPRQEGDTADIELGIVPLGTGNSFLRDFEIFDADAAVAALKRAHETGETRPLDVIRATCAEGVRHYINLCTTGFVTEVGDRTNRRFKSIGEVGYLVAALVGIVKLRWAVDPIRVDDDEFPDARPAAFLLFANSQFTGGSFHLAPPADPGDGKMDIVRPTKMPRLAFTRNVIKALEGKHLEDPRAEARQAKHVVFTRPRRQLVMLDGEIEHLTLQELQVLPAALRLLV